MVQTVQLLRSATNVAPAPLPHGALQVELGPYTRLWVGSATGNRLLLSNTPGDGGVGLGDAPNDGVSYLRSNRAWAPGTEEAPANGVSYGRLNHTWTPVLPLTGGQLTGALALTNGNLTLNAGGFLGSWAELGSMSSASTSFLDFHSSGTGSDYDTSLRASGGGVAAGLGTLTFLGAQFNVNSPLTVTGAFQASPVISYSSSAQGGGVGSQAGSWRAGFNVLSSGTLQWGNMDAAGAVSGVRMSLDTGSVLRVQSDVITPGTVTAAAAQINGNINAVSVAATGNLTAAAAGINGPITATGVVTAPSAQINGNINAATVTTTGNVVTPLYYVAGTGDFYLTRYGMNGRLLQFENNTYIAKDANSATMVIVAGNGGAIDFVSGGLTMTYNTAGDLNVPHNLQVIGRVQTGSLHAYFATTRGGFVGSYQGDSSNAGFWNDANTIYWGNADGSDVPQPGARMALDPAGNIFVVGGITSTTEMHAGGRGVYYPGIGGLHGFGFYWTGTDINVYVDSNYVGQMTLHNAPLDEEPTLLPDYGDLAAKVERLEARIAALEAQA